MTSSSDDERYLSHSAYYRRRFGRMVYRVSVDAGFGCPHRRASPSGEGCAFCDSAGSRAPYLGAAAELERQVRGASAFLRARYRAEAFSLYFQAFSGTFAPVGELRRLYDFALGLGDFRELIVATRPDCLDAEKAELLAGYAGAERDVWVELGLQSAHDDTLLAINRAHDRADFERAFGLLRGAGVKIAVHLIFGLPGEDRRRIMQSVAWVADLRPEGVKIHDLHVPIGCPWAGRVLDGELVLACRRRHLAYVVEALRRLPPDTVVMRLTCDTPAARLALPRRAYSKQGFLGELKTALAGQAARQGDMLGAPV